MDFDIFKYLDKLCFLFVCIIFASPQTKASFDFVRLDSANVTLHVDTSLTRISAISKNDTKEAIIRIKKLIDESAPYSNDSIQSSLKFRLSLYHLLYDNNEESRKVIEEIIDYYKEHNLVRYAILCNRLAGLEIRFGNYDKALSYAKEAINILITADKPLSLGLSYTYLSDIYIQKSNYNQAYRYADLALQTYEKTPDRYDYIAMANTQFAQINLLIKDYPEAERYFDLIFSNKEKIKRMSFLVRPTLYAGILEYEKGNFINANNLFEEGLEAIEEIGNFPDLSLVYQCLHKISLQKSNYNMAKKHIANAIKYATKAHHKRDRFKSLLLYQEFKTKYLGESLSYEKVDSIHLWALDNKDYEILKHSSELIANDFTQKGKYEKALAYKNILVKASENILQTEKVNEVNLFKEKTKAQQDLSDKVAKENELELQLASENRIRQIMLLSLILVTLLLSAIFYLYQRTRKAFSELKVTHGELKDAEKVLDGKNKELEKYIESNIQLSQFAHIASHDLKSPLRTIGSFTGLLKTKIRNVIGEKELSYFSFIEEATTGLSRLVDDLLKFSTINSQSITLESIDTKNLIEEVMKNIAFNIDNSNAEIKINQLPRTISADKMQLKQVFQNLMTNAIKFVPKDKTPKVNISGEIEDGKWLFKIKDNGIGIETQYSEKIFNDFARLHNKESYQGTGMGLAICKKIIEKHGGQIWVESKINEGSEFYFTIPITVTERLRVEGPKSLRQITSARIHSEVH